MKTIKRDKRGFTLVELLVTLAISSIALAAIYGVYKAQLQSHVTQNAVVDTQQSLRNTFFIMQRTIRMAGFDPTRDLRSAEANDLLLHRQWRGVHGRFKELCEDGRLTAACGTGFLNAVSSASAIAFTLNDTASLFDGGKCTTYPLNDIGCVDLEALDSELIAFRLNTNTGAIERFGPQTGWKTIAENIESLNIEYLDDQGRHIGPEGIGISVSPGDPLPLPPDSDKADKWLALNGNLRSVRITIEAKAIADSHNPLINQKKTDFTNHRTLTAQVRIRNSGIE
jgi:prepilin-type N-terminal cleavage/methylation domain-containing protein